MSCRTVEIALEGAFLMRRLPAGVDFSGLMDRCFLVVDVVGSLGEVVLPVGRGEVGRFSSTGSAALYLSALVVVGGCCAGAASNGLTFSVCCCSWGV